MDLDYFSDILRVMIFVVAILFAALSGIFVFTWVYAGFEVNAWNKLYNTNYTQLDWFSGADFIKKYHYPGRDSTEKKEINVNVNS